MKEASTPSPEEVRRQLQIVLASPAFHGSKRCQQFLEYVCEKFLEGQPGALKERTIAVEVFGRRPESDLAEDTIVRVGAREVRKRLAQFYVTPAGAASEVRIDLHPGAYAPEFRYVSPQHEEEVTPVTAPEIKSESGTDPVELTPLVGVRSMKAARAEVAAMTMVVTSNAAKKGR